jgi:DinB superfamily
MDNDFVNIEGMFKTNTDIVKKALDVVPPERWFLKPGNDSNHLMWVAGHLVVHRAAVLKYLDADWEAPWSSLFNRGAKLTADDAYPSVNEIRSAWDVVSAKLFASLTDPDPEGLSQPASEGPPSFDGKVSGHVAFLAFHETYHVGQLSYLKKWFGCGQTVG